MPDTIRQVDYYYVEVPDKAGEAAGILSALKQDGVNMLAFCGFPVAGNKAQIDIIPEDPEAFRKAAARHGWKLSDRKRAFLVQGDSDRVGAVADVLGKLAAQGISVVGSQAGSAGAGRWVMTLWVKPADFRRASEALGAS